MDFLDRPPACQAPRGADLLCRQRRCRAILWQLADQEGAVPRVVIADDHRIVRVGIAMALDAHADIQVVGQAGDGEEALALCCRVRPDVVVMDIAMPTLNGIEFTRAWKRESPRSRVLVLSMHGERDFVVGAFQAGASGYVLKTAGPDGLVEAIRVVWTGRSYVSPGVADVVLGEALGQSNADAPQLTPREREVIQLLSEGLNAKEAAARLNISDKTVHAFRAQVMRKLEINSMAELTKYALRHGLTTLN